MRWVAGLAGETENKAKLSPTKVELEPGLSLAKKYIYKKGGPGKLTCVRTTSLSGPSPYLGLVRAPYWVAFSRNQAVGWTGAVPHLSKVHCTFKIG